MERSERQKGMNEFNELASCFIVIIQRGKYLSEILSFPNMFQYSRFVILTLLRQCDVQ